MVDSDTIASCVAEAECVLRILASSLCRKLVPLGCEVTKAKAAAEAGSRQP